MENTTSTKLNGRIVRVSDGITSGAVKIPYIALLWCDRAYISSQLRRNEMIEGYIAVNA